MRVDSAAQSKGLHGDTSQSIPREGTRLRRMYDLLMANKGLPIKVSLTRFENAPYHTGQFVHQLQDFYGLDIRRIHNSRWVLAGEWFGSTYKDYIAERLQERA